ncbi:hypothetical protein FB451DRAFT_1164880 [Mycena latifolia]|nr:hypothetical protein FB451DRAFT_1164880 [Mycena latifolia]
MAIDLPLGRGISIQDVPFLSKDHGTHDRQRTMRNAQDEQSHFRWRSESEQPSAPWRNASALMSSQPVVNRHDHGVRAASTVVGADTVIVNFCSGGRRTNVPDEIGDRKFRINQLRRVRPAPNSVARGGGRFCRVVGWRTDSEETPRRGREGVRVRGWKMNQAELSDKYATTRDWLGRRTSTVASRQEQRIDRQACVSSPQATWKRPKRWFGPRDAIPIDANTAMSPPPPFYRATRCAGSPREKARRIGGVIYIVEWVTISTAVPTCADGPSTSVCVGSTKPAERCPELHAKLTTPQPADGWDSGQLPGCRGDHEFWLTTPRRPLAAGFAGTVLLD